MVSHGREYHQIGLHLQIIGGHVLCTAAHKDLARNLLHLTLLAVRDLDVAPPPVDHVPLGEHPHLRLVAREPDEAEALGLPGLDVLLHLSHQHLPERLKVFSQLLLCRFPGQAEHDQIGALVLALCSFQLVGVAASLVGFSLVHKVICVGDWVRGRSGIVS